MKEEQKKIYRTLLVFGVLGLLMIIRALYLQVINRDKLVTRYEGQTIRRSVVYPHRGAIYDRNGSTFAISLKSYTMAVTPRQFKKKQNRNFIYKQIAEIIPQLKLKTIQKKVKQRSSYTNLIKKIDLSDIQINAIRKLARKVGGIHIDPAPKRYYPNNELLSQTVGFVGRDNRGLAGIEYLFDKELRGRATTIRYIKDNKGRTFGRTIEEPGESSQDLYLSIDKQLQAIAEKAIKEAVHEFDATKGGVGVMDADTGELLAIANYPSFDPNNPKSAKVGLRKLPFVSDPFEPGSTFKIFTVASALENKMATPDRSFYCEKGVYRVQGHVISEAENKKKYEWLTVKEIIEHSSNIGTTKIAFDLTFPKLRKTLEDFRIGRKTGIEIPGESRGIFTSKKNITPLSLSNISFGQGVATTGIQVLAAYAAIANGGTYMTPTVIKGKKSEGERIMSKKTADQLTDMLVGVVEKGTGSRARINHFVIAGKTSTAQRPSPTGGYEGYVPGFVGFPVNVDDRFVIYVYVDNPKAKSYYGNTVAGPVFRKVAEYMLYKNKNFSKFAVHDEKKGTSKSLKNIRVNRVKRWTGKGRLPNFIGLDKISAIELSDKLRLKVKHRGRGVVSSQVPKAGSPLKTNQVLKLIYSPPSYE
jgi:cell division protein FtsI (penicillin-binding protein 3)